MKVMQWLTMLALLVMTTASWGLIFGPNLVENGGFEDGDSPWMFDSGTGVSTERPYADIYGVKMLNDSGYWGYAQQSITYFKGRTYYYSSRYSATGYIQNNRMYLGGSRIFTQTGYSSGGWKTGYGQYFAAGSGVATDLLKVTSSVGTSANNQTAYWDTVSFTMESSSPVVSSDSLSGDLDAGVESTFSLFNAGGNDSEAYSINFDPDIAISAVNADSVSILWVSDTEAQVTLTPTAAGTVSLTLTNVLSDRSYDYQVNAVPEPMTMVLLGLGTLGMLRRR